MDNSQFQIFPFFSFVEYNIACYEVVLVCVVCLRAHFNYGQACFCFFFLSLRDAFLEFVSSFCGMAFFFKFLFPVFCDSKSVGIIDVS